jgi:hypothetical protein
LTDDFLKLFVENRVRIFDGLEEFVKDDIGFWPERGWEEVCRTPCPSV